MLQLTTKYDKIGDSRKKVFMIRGDEAYAHTTNITLEQNGNITTGDNRGFKINLRGTIYRNLGSSNVTIYDGEEILSLIPIGDGEHSFSLNNLYLSYVYDHELYAVFDANSQCMGSKSKKIALNVPLPSTLKTSITFDNLPTQVNPNANVNVRMIARMNNDIVADGTEIKVYDNNVLVGTGETSDGVATVTINGMSQGKHTITASIEKSTTINATSSSADISCGYNMEFTTIPNIFMNNTNNTVRITVRDYYDAVVPNKSVSFASKTATTNNQGVATFTITSMTNGSTYTATCSGSTVSRTVNAFTVSSLNLSVEDGVTATNQDEKISIALTGSGYTGSIPTTITTSTGISNSTYLRNNDVTDWYYQGESAGDVTVSVKCGNLTKTVTIEDIQMGYKANSYQYNLDYSYNGTFQKNPTHLVWGGLADSYLTFNTDRWTPLHSIEFSVVEVTGGDSIIFGMEDMSFSTIPNLSNGDVIRIVNEDYTLKYYKNDTLVNTIDLASQNIARWQFRVATIYDPLNQSQNRPTPQLKFNNLKIK